MIDFHIPKRLADEAKPTDIEFETVGDPVSKSLSKAPEKFKSSKLSSSKALPKILKMSRHIYCSKILVPTLKQVIILLYLYTLGNNSNRVVFQFISELSTTIKSSSVADYLFIHESYCFIDLSYNP